MVLKRSSLNAPSDVRGWEKTVSLPPNQPLKRKVLRYFLKTTSDYEERMCLGRQYQRHTAQAECTFESACWKNPLNQPLQLVTVPYLYHSLHPTRRQFTMLTLSNPYPISIPTSSNTDFNALLANHNPILSPQPLPPSTFRMATCPTPLTTDA